MGSGLLFIVQGHNGRQQMDTGHEAWVKAAENAARGEWTVYTLPSVQEARAFAQSMRVARARDARAMGKVYTPEEAGKNWGKSQWDRLKLTVVGCEVRIELGGDELPPERHGTGKLEVEDDQHQ